MLIADGNYPFSTGCPPTAAHVFLNVRPGLVDGPGILAPLVATIPVESAMVMEPADGAPVPVHAEYAKLLPADLPMTRLKRHEFYAEARSAETALVIATGEQRRFANLLLTIGVVMPPNP